MTCAPARADPSGLRLLSTVIAVGVALSGCESSGTAPQPEPVPAGIRFASAELTLFVPTTASLGALVVDQFGTPMPGRSLTFETRDSTAVKVDTAGLVTPVAAGESWIVARSAALVDSVRVTVRYHVLLDEARVRLRGGIDAERSWDPFSLAISYLGPSGRGQLYLEMVNEAPADTGLIVLLPSMPEPGDYPLDILSPSEILGSEFFLDEDRPLGFMIVETVSDLFLYTARPGSRLEIESVEAAGGYGLAGSHRGRVVLRADGHRLDPASRWTEEPTWLPTGDTLTVYGDFAVSYMSWVVGQASFTLEGGPSPMIAEGREAWWSAMDWLEPGYGRIDVEDGPPDVVLYGPGPQVGVSEIDSLGRGEGFAPGRRVLQLNSWTEPSYWAAAQSGELTISEVRQPSGEEFGELIGSLTADLAFWQGVDPNPFDTGTIALEFHVPIFPDDGWTAAAAMGNVVNTPFLERLRPRLGGSR